MLDPKSALSGELWLQKHVVFVMCCYINGESPKAHFLFRLKRSRAAVNIIRELQLWCLSNVHSNKYRALDTRVEAGVSVFVMVLVVFPGIVQAPHRGVTPVSIMTLNLNAMTTDTSKLSDSR